METTRPAPTSSREIPSRESASIRVPENRYARAVLGTIAGLGAASLLYLMAGGGPMPPTPREAVVAENPHAFVQQAPEVQYPVQIDPQDAQEGRGGHSATSFNFDTNETLGDYMKKTELP